MSYSSQPKARSNVVFEIWRARTPEDIAKPIRAIADGLLDYCAGQVIDADGGFHPTALITRQAIAAFLYRYDQLIAP